MSKKTVKDLDSELTDFKVKFVDLQAKFDKLNKKHEELEKKYDEILENRNFKCSDCDLNFQTVDQLRKHKTSHKSTDGSFQCNGCEKLFNKEWKLKSHIKIHRKFPCEKCDNTFENEDTKEKHNAISHENLKLYCHYFNNGKECPYNTECVFLHQVSKMCKYKEICERELCMFRHQKCDDIENIEDDVADEIQNETFSNPSQTDVPSVTIAFDVYAPCRDTYLKNDQAYYWSELEKFSEIEKIEHLYVHSRSGYKVGTYLETYIKMTTKYFKNDKIFRQAIWDRLQIKETCPE